MFRRTVFAVLLAAAFAAAIRAESPIPLWIDDVAVSRTEFTLVAELQRFRLPTATPEAVADGAMRRRWLDLTVARLVRAQAIRTVARELGLAPATMGLSGSAHVIGAESSISRHEAELSRLEIACQRVLREEAAAVRRQAADRDASGAAGDVRLAAKAEFARRVQAAIDRSRVRIEPAATELLVP